MLIQLIQMLPLLFELLLQRTESVYTSGISTSVRWKELIGTYFSNSFSRT